MNQREPARAADPAHSPAASSPKSPTPLMAEADLVRSLFESILRTHHGLCAVLAEIDEAESKKSVMRVHNLRDAQRALCEFQAMQMNDLDCALVDAGISEQVGA